MRDVKGKIRDFISERLLESGRDLKVEDDTSLILSGLLESLIIVQLIVFIESEYKVDFSEIFFDQNMFDTINDITKFIKEHMQC